MLITVQLVLRPPDILGGVEKVAEQSNRLVSLDYLRGYFIIVIIIDHLSRFPSAWQLITGQGLLWATAAEGFLMISGLMIGYVRGLKDKSRPFSNVASKLLKRSLLLYVWMVIGSLLYVALTWNLATLTNMPWYNAPTGDWAVVVNQVITMQVPHVWVHFLYLYAIFLALSVPAVWLLRYNQPWIIACFSIVGYIYGLEAGIEWLRLQIIFFIPVIAGFYIPAITTRWRSNQYKLFMTRFILISALVTVCISAFYVMNESAIPGAAKVNQIFTIERFNIARVAISALWFTALVLAFHRITPWLQSRPFGVVRHFGTHSLTAYIAHGLVLCGVSIAIPIKDSFIVNTLAGFAAVLGVYVFIRLPVLRKLLPR